ncbi:hypothetical protein CY34DRAFT_810244 [Suillus luteus UH-Slu-Lm8-n1]|uniref:Uncharacterized protein n=1 Tax=Suillus luteus UH-Slu-Lm8-n1 TaxID=930992 RepID=A0A0C9ZJC4_9AGAM|nr:hypothetical protein CY34DRAFT_810244 [Suillus luteus UH-Slu-Lm8-n1]
MVGLSFAVPIREVTILIDKKTAYVSDLIRAPIYAYDAQVELDWLPSPAIPEVLLLWMAACVGAGGISWTPCDNKTIS